MKKILFVVFMTVAMCFASCGQKAPSTLGSSIDSTSVDTTVVDSTVVDTLVADSVVL